MSTTESPTKYPTANPTTSPSTNPTRSPSLNPTGSPSVGPTVSPTASPSRGPSESPTSLPSLNPSSYPSAVPSDLPSLFPSTFPSANPSSPPSDIPSLVPTSWPSAVPTKSPEAAPTTSPTRNPSLAPTKTPSTSPSQSPVIPCGTQARKVKIESTTQQSIHVFEVRVFSSGSNVAVGKTATQSSTFQNFDASRAVDGSAKSFSHTKDGFSVPSWEGDTSPWWEVDLGGLFHIDTVQILNRFCADPSDPDGCLCRLTNATLSLRDQNDLVVESKSFGDTCGLLTLKESFADDSPSCTTVVDVDALEGTADDSKTDRAGSPIGLIVTLALVSIGVFLGLASLVYRGRKRRQQQQKEDRLTADNISPYNRKYRRQRAKGLYRKANGEEVLSNFDDMNLMVEVKNSAAGGWNCLLDQDSLEQFDFTSVPTSSARAVNPGSLQDLEEIEKSLENVGRETDQEEATDEELVRAYREAMAMDEEPQNEITAALIKKYDMPGLGETTNVADSFHSKEYERMPSCGHDIT